MMPMYIKPSQPGQMRPSQGCYHQGFGDYASHTAMDASSPALNQQHWPTPSPCYGSCVHGNFPAYTPYWPSCYPPQVPYHTCCAGFHPHAPPYYFHQPLPVGYQPGYESESDRYVPGEHRCTKCSPQMCYPKKNDRSIVIEEHEPEIEKGNHGESVNHVRQTSCPYPIIWIPHENARNQEHDQPPAEINVPESTEVRKSHPKPWNGGEENTLKLQNGKTVQLPFGINKLKSLLQGQEEGKELQFQENKEPGQLQYPIIWIPSRGKQETVEASEKEPSNEGSSNLRSFPSDHLNEGQVARGSKGSTECNVRSDEGEKRSMRNIPVEIHLQEPRNSPVKLLENQLPEPTEPVEKTEDKEQQPSSPPKASRLPPVCLRVDPLPKRKNGDSKSLSPRRRKEQPLALSSKKADTKTVPKACNVKCEEANKEKKMSECRPHSTGAEKVSVESKSLLQKGASSEIVEPCETKENTAKKTFTEDEAARVIQSRYRGYDVRRWEPIKKLKEIATVREQMGDVKKRIQALEVSSDQHSDGKEIVILGEMVMSLLLKLDSVQGLHPSIRDYRKSLARELSDMEENLDSLKKSSAEKETVGEQVEITSQTSHCPENLEQGQIVGMNKMVHDSITEKVLLPPSPEEHPINPKNTTDEQLLAEAEEVTGLSETLVTDPEPAAETSISEVESTTTPGEVEAVMTVLPINPSSGDDGNELAVTNMEEENVVLEEPPRELPQVVETTDGPGCEGPENAAEDSETVASASSENEDGKRDDNTVLPSEEDLELSELPVEVVDDETQLLSEDPSSRTHEAEPETEGQEETTKGDDHSNSKGIVGQVNAAPREEPPETEVMGDERREETKKLMEENRRFKETMETLVKAGREQVEVISKLTGRVKSLEKKLSQKKRRTRIGRRKPNREKHATKLMSPPV